MNQDQGSDKVYSIFIVIVYSVFIIEMAVILMNLMIGLAISNIQVSSKNKALNLLVYSPVNVSLFNLS